MNPDTGSDRLRGNAPIRLGPSAARPAARRERRAQPNRSMEATGVADRPSCQERQYHDRQHLRGRLLEGRFGENPREPRRRGRNRNPRVPAEVQDIGEARTRLHPRRRGANQGPPDGEDGAGNQDDPGAGPSLGWRTEPQHHGGGQQEPERDWMREDRRDEQRRREQVAAQVPAFEREQRAEAPRSRSTSGWDGRRHHLPRRAEKHEQRCGQDCRQVADPAASERVEEHAAGEDEGG